MSRQSLKKLSGIFLALSLVACAAYQAQQSARREGEKRGGAKGTSVAPDRVFAELPEGDQVARIRGEVSLVKETLARDGRYACCVEPACTECLLKYGECHCREAVQKEGPCCGECTEAWVEGRGAVEGVTAWELLERKKDVLRQVHEHGEDKPPHH